MTLLKYLVVNIIETLLRVMPFPCKTGLVKIGNPDGNSPVFLTCNFHLTVERVKRALRGIDCFLLIANSRGINVWCGSAGGHFTNHSVISVLKTSGIEKLVNHRNVILPQLAAAGIEAVAIQKKTGWRVIWGPVYAKDIPLFIENGFKKTPEIKEVRFPWKERVEMAIAWAFPISIVLAILIIPFWRSAILSLVILVWALSFFIFLSFPLYSRWLNPRGKRIGFVFFDFGRGGFQLFLWAFIVLTLVLYSILSGNFSWGFLLRWSFISLVVILVLSLDLMGSTPTFKSGLHEERLLKVVLDEKKCTGCGFCEQVCPRNCYNMDNDNHIAIIQRPKRCVQCGACIIQCSLDALYFKTPKGGIIPPDNIRKFKLNIIGKRIIQQKNQP